MRALPRTRQERVARKERAILDAALEAFVRHGYEGARIAEIARGAGISEGSIYSYYATKSDLMRALASEFWERITAGAVEAVRREATTLGKLAALARFHLGTVMDNFDFVSLTVALRGRPDALAGSKDEMRHYVAILDDVLRHGIDRGDLRPGTTAWLVRDTFYGTLEYAARTLVQRKKTLASKEARTVVEHLVEQLDAVHGVQRAARTATARTPDRDAPQLLARLEAVAARLEAATDRTRTPAKSAPPASRGRS